MNLFWPACHGMYYMQRKADQSGGTVPFLLGSSPCDSKERYYALFQFN